MAAASPFEHGSPFFHSFANGLVFLLAVVLTDVVLGRWLPYPNIPEAGEKIHYLALHGDQYDTLFLGSSRVNFQIKPAQFDALLAEHGISMKSFNAGIIGMRPPEQGFYLDHVLRQPHRRLRWVIIELTSIEAYTPPSRRGSARFVFWHDGPRMRLLGTWVLAAWADLHREAAAGQSPVRWTDYFEPLSVYLTHVPPFVQKELNFGGATIFGERFLLTPAQLAKQRNHWPGLGEHLDGWMPYSVHEVMDERERAAYLKSYQERLQTPATPVHDLASDDAMSAMAAAVTRAGATPIFIVPPTTSATQFYPPPDEAAKMIIWSFSDLQRYAALFDPNNRVDALHLNSAGAQQFTLALAERFLELPASLPSSTHP
jgi:hypothetical protein